MRAFVTLSLCVAAATATAQPVYRCGNVYSDSACPQARMVDVGDTRTAAQRADARSLAASDRQLGEQMAAERAARDASERRAAKSPRAKPAKHARATKIRWFRP